MVHQAERPFWAEQMSLESRKIWPKILVVVAGLIFVAAALTYIFFPWAKISNVEIKSAFRFNNSEDSNVKPIDPLFTKVQYVVEFSTSDNLASLQKNKDVGVIYANLFECRNKSWSNSEVVSQRAEYANDRGRVRFLGQTKALDGSPKYNYLVSFDARLRALVNNEFLFRDPSIVAGGLCFDLSGGSMWFGAVWSDTTRLNFKNPVNQVKDYRGNFNPLGSAFSTTAPLKLAN
jgi:hypothetical protein